jgi:hypothetical protein
MVRDPEPATDPIGAVDFLASVLSDEALTATDGAPWERPVGQLQWSCTKTLAHVVDCTNWYAAMLARCSPVGVHTAEMGGEAGPEILLDAAVSGATVIAAAVDRARPNDRAWHPFGSADRSGFAAMGVDEILVHGGEHRRDAGRPLRTSCRPLCRSHPAALSLGPGQRARR